MPLQNRQFHNSHLLTDRLVGEALQLGRYMDPSVVEVARRELAEAYELDQHQLDSAAYTLADQNGKIKNLNFFTKKKNLAINLNNTNNLTDRNYLEHVGGYHAEEINDINLYSQQSLFRPADNNNSYISSDTIINNNNNNLSPLSDSQHQRQDGDLLLVTTL